MALLMAKYRARVSEIQACLNISEPKPILALRLANGQTRCQIGVQHNVFFIVQVVADLHPAIYNRKCRARVSAIKLVLIVEPKPTLTPKGGKPITINLKCRARVSAIKLVLIAEPKPTLTPKGGKPLTINH